MNPIKSLRFGSGAARTSNREVGKARRRRRAFLAEPNPLLEGRLLLASFTLTYTATVPAQKTDYTVPIPLPKFDPNRGTLNQVDLALNASGAVVGNITSTAPVPVSFQFEQDTSVSVSDASTTLLSPTLVSM